MEYEDNLWMHWGTLKDGIRLNNTEQKVEIASSAVIIKTLLTMQKYGICSYRRYNGIRRKTKTGNRLNSREGATPKMLSNVHPLRLYIYLSLWPSRLLFGSRINGASFGQRTAWHDTLESTSKHTSETQHGYRHTLRLGIREIAACVRVKEKQQIVLMSPNNACIFLAQTLRQYYPFSWLTRVDWMRCCPDVWGLHG